MSEDKLHIVWTSLCCNGIVCLTHSKTVARAVYGVCGTCGNVIFDLDRDAIRYFDVIPDTYRLFNKDYDSALKDIEKQLAIIFHK